MRLDAAIWCHYWHGQRHAQAFNAWLPMAPFNDLPALLIRNAGPVLAGQCLT